MVKRFVDIVSLVAVLSWFWTVQSCTVAELPLDDVGDGGEVVLTISEPDPVRADTRSGSDSTAFSVDRDVWFNVESRAINVVFGCFILYNFG